MSAVWSNNNGTTTIKKSLLIFHQYYFSQKKLNILPYIPTIFPLMTECFCGNVSSSSTQFLFLGKQSEKKIEWNYFAETL
jgi:hypothetical protein